MKRIVGFDNDLGGGKVGGELGVSGSDVEANIHFKFPIASILAPVEKVVGDGLDKIEQLIPGDQKVFFEGLKKELMEQLVKVLSE